MHTHTHTHTHTVQTDRGDGQCCLVEIFREDKCPEFAFEGRESSRVPDVLGEIVPGVGAKYIYISNKYSLLWSFFQLFLCDDHDDEMRKGRGKRQNFRPAGDFFGDWAGK